MTLLSKGEILAKKELPTRDVDVPEWGGMVRVRALTGRQRDTFETQAADARKKGADPLFRARLAAMAIIDEQGARMFKDEDADELSTLSGAALDRLFDAVDELSGISRAAQEQAKKNSATAPG